MILDQLQLERVVSIPNRNHGYVIGPSKDVEIVLIILENTVEREFVQSVYS